MSDDLTENPLEDSRYSELFGALDTDAAPLDPEFLAALRTKSTSVFLDAAATKVTPQVKQRPQWYLAASLAAAALIAAIMVTAVLRSGAFADERPTFADALTNLEQAKTLELKIARDGKAESVFLNRPSQKLRWNHADGTYDVAHKDKQWAVDEKENRATARKVATFSAGLPGFDLFGYLSLPTEIESSVIGSAEPVGQTTRGGALCYLYRWIVPDTAGPLTIEATVDAHSRMLQTLQSSREVAGRRQPLVTVSLVSVDRPIDDSVFVVGKALTEDGRIGKVADVQGIVTLKPVMAKRWTPVVTNALVRPGDWVRTDVRGANAVAIRLASNAVVTVGPGSLVELIKPSQLRLVSGELRISTAAGSPIELLSGKNEKLTVTDAVIVRLTDGKLLGLEIAPLWLSGFEGNTNNESLGSLVAKVDGREVPLTVGYHKVTVDIRDQIARTVIEESFVNHTPARLEGVFYFPLPQDASISGFGMWIGSEYVEADIVEKQRAREIYETILRERRDPGLLEWTGGNIFKARVFPIEGRSEKRIKISYTQVLPLRGREFRYSYSLQSELLKLHPLRELSIDVKLNSASPLTGIHSPTHEGARIDNTPHSAHVEFAAQEFSPDRDFEVVAELAENRPNVVLIPHRRGDDGYFMLMVAPPNGSGQWHRDALAVEKPLKLLVLADTSASMDAASRSAQSQFVASLLESLGPDDKFNLAVCDVDCQWAFTGLQTANEANVGAARDKLANRVSLGWTDLDIAFKSALDQADGETQIVYVGDGIVTTRDTDPVAFAQRLRLLCKGTQATLNAVAVSSSSEPQVMRAIGSIGGGSVRQIAGEQTPQAVAADVLREISRPTLRDMHVAFKGIETARVYPRELPNLPEGSQQILLGRYLPQGKDQQGSVTVTGTLADEPVKFTTELTLPNAPEAMESDDDMSFIPRLWARMHLDALLDQGRSQAIQDEIIALSEEYHIMTPYTSLLVLESDADRERFKVKRRFQMRDADRFFAEGRDKVDYELLGQQMRRAGTWRLGLRQQVLAELLGLGRDSTVLAPSSMPMSGYYSLGGSGVRQPILAGLSDGRISGIGGSRLRTRTDSLDELESYSREIAGAPSAATQLFAKDLESRDKSLITDEPLAFPFGESDMDFGDDHAAKQAATELSLVVSQTQSVSAWDRAKEYGFESLDINGGDFGLANKPMGNRFAGEFAGGGGGGWAAAEFSRRSPAHDAMGYQWDQYTTWAQSLFPILTAVPDDAKPIEHKPEWTAEAKSLVAGLLRTEVLTKIAGGLRIESHSDGFEPQWDELTSRSERIDLVSPKSWLVRTSGVGSQTIIQWGDEKSRGIYSLAFQLGRERKSSPRDLSRPPLALPDFTLSPLDDTYNGYKAELQSQADGTALLILTSDQRAGYEIRFQIDSKRKVVLSVEQRQDEKTVSITRYDEFVEVAAAWWPGRTQTFDADGKRTSLTASKFSELDVEKFKQQIAEQLDGLDQVALIADALPTHPDAARALKAGRADINDRFELLLHFCASQQWDKVLEQLDAVEKLATNKPGMRWVRDAVQSISRRSEELKQRINSAATDLAKAPPQGVASSEELFVANYLLGQAGAICANNEMLDLLDVLKPVFERQPTYVAAMKSWSQSRAGYLRNAGRIDESLAIVAKLATDYPHDDNLQIGYANFLFDTGDYAAAYAWLDKTIADDARWTSDQDQRLREKYDDFLESQGRWSDAVNYLARWVERRPNTTSAYERYLSTLLRLDRLAEMNALVEKWLAAGRVPGKVPPAELAQLQAAINQALGQGYAIRTNRLDPRWIDQLAETVRYFVRHPLNSGIADQIMGNSGFNESDQCRQLRREFFTMLASEIATLKPSDLNRLIGWTLANDPAIENDQWRPLADQLQERWSAETDDELKNQLASPLIQILSSRFPDDHLKFLRRQLAEGPEKYRPAYAEQLFATLLSRPWTAEFENELLSLIDQLPSSQEPAQRLATKVQAIYRITDRVVPARYESLMAKVEHQEKLTRTELREKQSENMRHAREGYSDRLGQARQEAKDDLRPWFNIERLYLETQLGRNENAIAEECREYLGPKPPSTDATANNAVSADTLLELRLAQTLRTRFLVTAANLAARHNAKPELATRLLAYIDAAIAQAPPEDVAWKYLKYQMLVALDRPKELESSLREWVRADDPLNYWRISLAYVLAEQGKIAEAIPLMEAVQADGELGPGEFRTLADWCMVVDQREKREKALVAVFAAAPEWQLQNWLWQKLRPWQYIAGNAPSELDKDVIRVFASLFQKSSTPQGYTGQLREFYMATRDFRLLSGLADAVIGQTAERVYPLLQSFDSVFAEIREEATVDSMVAEIKIARQRARNTLDQRALDLLEVIVQRRASQLENQAEPHAADALAALRRAFEREWLPGEQRLFADFLAGLGTVRQDDFAQEQLRELRTLHEASAVGTIDRLSIGSARARCLWGYEHKDEAIDLLESALNEFRASHDGVLPVEANGALDTYISYLESRGLYARGEQVLFAELKHPVNPQQSYYLRLRTYRLYRSAIANDGQVSLGTASALFKAVQEQLQKELDTPDQNYRRDLVDEMCNIYFAARDKKLPGFGDDLRAFAVKRMPDVLRMQTSNRQQMVMRVAETLRQVHSPRDGLEFLVSCIEQEPKWLQYSNESGWQQFGYQLADWRQEAQTAAPIDAGLQERLLAITLRALRGDLETRHYFNRYLYHREYGGDRYYWSDKESDFRRVADEVYEPHKSSSADVSYIADYLYHGVHHFDRAIEILFIADRDKVLDEAGQTTLVQCLQDQKRFGESIAILERLVKLRPDNLEHRTRLMRAYFHTQRQTELLALRKETDAYFHEQGRWGEGPLAALAAICLETSLFEQSVAYYEELIPLHQRSQPNRGIGNGTLSSYYSNEASAYSGLKNTTKAVDAACGAIVSWGSNDDNRRGALETLRTVLRGSPDLDKFAAELNQQVKTSGLENPIVRKALGAVYLEKQQFAAAITQLELARQAQPNDVETCKLLVECYDKQNDKAGAVRQLLTSAELSRRDIELYKDLGRRYRELEQADEAERAVTSIVEVLPAESESHAMLAEIRQEENHWNDAIDQWRRVSELRSLEPTGLLRLVAAQIHQKQWDAAKQTLQRIRSHEWPSRFNNVENEARELERQLEQAQPH